MNDYQNDSPNLTLKRPSATKYGKRQIHFKTENSTSTRSQPVTPSKFTLCTKMKSSRDTIDYFIQFTEKNKHLIQNKLTSLPSIIVESGSSKLIRSNNHNQTKKRYRQKESFKSQEAPVWVLKKKLGREDRGTTAGSQRMRSGSKVSDKVSEKSLTCDIERSPKIKPLIMKNKLLSKLNQGKKPAASYQMKYFRSKVIKLNREVQNPQMLFTFYPRQEPSPIQTTNQFLSPN